MAIPSATASTSNPLTNTLHAVSAVSQPAASTDRPTVLLVVGAPGESDFGTNFLEQVDLWTRACSRAGAHLMTVGLDPNQTPDDLTRLERALADLPREGSDAWIVLAGHGTYDGREAKFNLRGPDLSATNLATWLRPFGRRLAIVNTSSSSAPFLKALSGTNRVVVTATRSGHELNFARFGRAFAECIADPSADLDYDGQTSLLEAFLAASHRVGEFYKSEGRLATEHPLIDDNGDGLGTPADWFRGLRPVKRSKEGAPVDGLRAHQVHLVRSAEEDQLPAEARTRRDELELAVAQLRDRKKTLPEDEYYSRLEALLLDLARVYSPDPASPPKAAPRP